MTRSNEKYPAAYGQWAGNPKGTAPNLTRCCEEVYDSEVTRRFFQCQRKRGHGPGEQYCKQHTPDAKAARTAAALAKSNADYNKRLSAYHAGAFLRALRQIAAGDNDARATAREVLKAYDDAKR